MSLFKHNLALLAGDCKIFEKIGEGAFGEVWRAQYNGLDCAVKQINVFYSNLSENQAFLEGITTEGIKYYYESLFKNSIKELEIMRELSECENIVNIKDYIVCEESGQGWSILIVMELLQPLCDYLANGEIDIKKIVQLAINICSALETCEEHKILHRDIKPDNIFYCAKTDTFKLGDFGIAEDMKSTTAINGKGGTITHMSPEVYRGNNYTFSDDLYALGIVIYKLINRNRIPLLPDYPENFTTQQRNDAIYSRLRGKKIPAPLLSKELYFKYNSPIYNTSAINDFCNVVRRIISENKSERYASAKKLRAVLEQLYIQLT